MNRLAFGIVLVLFLPSCRGAPAHLLEEDPARRIADSKRVSQEKDFSKAGQLIEELSDEDPAVRFFASEALQRLAGTDFGYVYWKEPYDQKDAIERWKAWEASQ